MKNYFYGNQLNLCYWTLTCGWFCCAFANSFKTTNRSCFLHSLLAFSNNNIHKITSLCWSTEKIFSPYQSNCQKIGQGYIYTILILILLLILILNFSWCKKILWLTVNLAACCRVHFPLFPQAVGRKGLWAMLPQPDPLQCCNGTVQLVSHLPETSLLLVVISCNTISCDTHQVISVLYCVPSQFRSNFNDWHHAARETGTPAILPLTVSSNDWVDISTGLSESVKTGFHVCVRKIYRAFRHIEIDN